MVLAGILSVSQTPAPLPGADPDAELQAPGSSKLLTDWMALHLGTIRSSKVPSHHIRQLAYIGVAVYESLVAGDPNYQSLAGQLNGYDFRPTVPPSGDFCWQASANAAFAETFRYFEANNPVTLSKADSMEQACKQNLTRKGFSDASIVAGSQYGSQVARQVIAWSITDGEDKANAPYALPKGTGLYEPTPPAFMNPIYPHMGDCRTFVRGSIDNTLPPAPPSFSQDPQSDFYKMAGEVYTISQQEDDKKVSTALFWDDFPNGITLTGGGHWESILMTVMKQLNLSLMDGAGVFAELFATMQDAAIGCFKAKYTYNQLRPVTYIQKYMNKSDWKPLIITPPHPEYPAAHAVISMSAATILTRLLGNNLAFTDNTYAYRQYPAHRFSNFIEAGHEAGMSRLYGGIHYKPSIEAGFAQGEKVADNVGKALVTRKNGMLSSQ